MSIAAPTKGPSSVTLTEINFRPTAMVRELAKNWGWILACGILSIIGGTAALLAPVMATGVVALFIAATLLVIGSVNLCGIFFAEKDLRFDSFLIGTVQVLLAALIGFYPFASLMSMTILILSVFLVEGVARIGLAVKTRNTAGWGWIMASGVATVAMCSIIFFGLPEASLWVIGVLVGVNLIFSGVARIAIAIQAKRLAKIDESCMES